MERFYCSYKVNMQNINFSLQAAKLYDKAIDKEGDKYLWETESVKHFQKTMIVCRDKFLFSCESGVMCRGLKTP